MGSRSGPNQSDGAPLSELDGALRAVVAADRLALSEAAEGSEELLRRRLTVFYGYFAALIVLSWLVSVNSPPPAGWDVASTALLLRIEGALAFILSAVLAALKLRPWPVPLLRGMDIVATLSTALAAGAAVAKVPYALSIDVSAVAFFILFFALRAALVPSRPWLATLIAAVCALPFTAGIAALYRQTDAALVVDASEATATVIANFAAAVGGVFVVSKTFYGLRGAMERAVQLGQYIIHEPIGGGGMGTVYRASHAMLKRPTAIKLIAPGRTGHNATARFEREVMASSRLSHPNNVAIYDYGRTRGGAFYYAMELLDGEDLGQLVEREGPQPEARTRRILRQVCAALGEAHAAGLVHRDIKPENIMLCTRGNVRDFVKVLDYGLVKDAAASADTKLTSDGTLAGTPLYLAPEAIAAPESVGPAADSYALGCVAFFLLAARPPFPGQHLVEVCAAHLHGVPDPPSKHAPAPVSPELDALVLRCLDKKPEERPTMAELDELLSRAAAAPAPGSSGSSGSSVR